MRVVVKLSKESVKADGAVRSMRVISEVITKLATNSFDDPIFKLESHVSHGVSSTSLLIRNMRMIVFLARNLNFMRMNLI